MAFWGSPHPFLIVEHGEREGGEKEEGGKGGGSGWEGAANSLSHFLSWRKM